MGCIGGPAISKPGNLTLALDREDVVSYPGEPTYNYLDDPKDMTTGNWAIGNSAGQLERIGGFPDPFGGNNAIYFQQDAGSSYPHVRQYGVTDSTDQYTFSVWLKSLTGSTTVVICCFRQSPWAIYQQQVYTMTTSWVKYSMTFTPSNASAGSFHVIHQSGGAPAASYLIAYPQAEKNSHPTNFVMDSSRSRSTTAGWKDLSGNGNHVDLTSISYTAATTQVPEKREFTFNGSSTYATCANGGIDIDGINQFTLSYWTKSSDTSGEDYVISKQDGSGNGYEGFRFGHVSGAYRFRMSDGTDQVEYDSPGSSTHDGNWHHYAFAGDGNVGKNVIVYIDGEVVDSTNAYNSVDDIVASQTCLIGAGYSGGNQWFDGDIDVVHMYNVALTATEIKSNFNAQRGRFGV